MRATNYHRPYQGYPYVNPPVNDAPSIDAARAAQWNHLPRKQIELPLQRAEPTPTVYFNMIDEMEPERPATLPMKPDPDPSPEVYIEMPTSGSHVSTERRYSSTDEEPESGPARQDKRKSTDEAVVYIDMPLANGSDVAHSPQNEDVQEEPEYVQETIFFNPFENRRIEMHKDETIRDSDSDDESTASSLPPRRPLPPIRPNTLDIYGAGSSGYSVQETRETIFFNPFEKRRIEMRKDETLRNSDSDDESTASSLPPRRPPPPIRPNTLDIYGAGSSGYSVQETKETIFFNPFEKRRIEMRKDETLRNSDSDDESIASSLRARRPLPPIRPNTLDLYGAGSSGAGSSSNPASDSTPGLPGLMSKETMLYGQDEGGFPMSPIPVSEFPEPPPAYAEIDRVSSPVVEPQEPVVEQPRREEPPRTQVILPRDPAPTTPIGLPNSERKYLNCHHCGMRVHTLVIRENGTITHVTAMMFFIICLLPCVAFIYCTDVFKIKNHYCPSCNKIIGYELPFGSKKIVYVN